MKNKKLTIKEVRLRITIKWIFYVLIAVASYVLSTTRIAMVSKPIMLIPIVLAICIRENEITAAIVGAVAGLMIDSAGGTLFGYHAVLMLGFSMLTSMLFDYLLRENVFNIFWIDITAIVIIELLDYFFFYVIWKIENVNTIFWNFTLPSTIYTIIVSVPLYYLVKVIADAFGRPRQYFLDEQNENKVRE